MQGIRKQLARGSFYLRSNKEKLRGGWKWLETLWVCLTDDSRLWGLLKLMDELTMTVYHSAERIMDVS